MPRIETVVKGDIIVERVGGKNRMTPVRKVEHNRCSKPSVHINGNTCYDWGTHVRLAEAGGTLGDLEKEASALGDSEEDYQELHRWFATGNENAPHLKHVHVPLSEEDLADLLVQH